MIPWVLVYDEHYRKYCEKRVKPHDLDSLQSFLKEIGTPSLLFQTPKERVVSTFVSYRQVPYSSCIRLRTSEEYDSTVQKILYPKPLYAEPHEKKDKSTRSSSCVIV